MNSYKNMAALVQGSQQKNFLKGDWLFRHCEPAKTIFQIKSGKIKIIKTLGNGSQPTLDIRKKGDFVGEAIFSNEIQHNTGAICIEDSTVFEFTKKQIESVISENPNIGLQILNNLSQRILSLTNRLGCLTVPNIEERLYDILCNIAHEYGAKSNLGLVINLPLTHQDLSFLTGVHRVTITRAMKALKQQGKLIYKERQFILTA